MDINSQQLINTFVGGMNTDTSDSLLESNQYRYAENLRVVTNTDSNSGELRMIEGTKVFIPQLTGPNGWDEIVKLDKVRDIVVFITRTNSGTWSIWKFKDGNAATPTRIFGPCNTKIWETGHYPNLSTVLNYESENNIKYYIADGIHEIMVLNVANNPITVPLDFGFLTEYRNVLLSEPQVVVSNESGQLQSAKVQYAYRLYSKYGSATLLSILSKCLSLYKDRALGYPQHSKTGRAVDVTIPQINTQGLNRIQIFRITYEENGQVPTVSLIRDEVYNSNYGTVVDRGDNDIRTLAISEFLSMVETKIMPKRIESKNNYLFAANLSYSRSQVNDKFKNLDLSKYFELNPCVTDLRYTVSIDQQDTDFKAQHASFRPGEMYRFGVIFYDEDGNESDVFFLLDVEIKAFAEWPDLIRFIPTPSPYDVYDPGYGRVVKSDKVPQLKFLSDYTSVAYKSEYSLSPIEINVVQKQIIPHCTRYEIVRCLRTISDKRTITQGIVGRTMEEFNGEESTKNLSPSGFMSLGYFENRYWGLDLTPTPSENPTQLTSNNSTNKVEGRFAKSSDNVLMFASPEYAYQEDDVKDLLSQYTNIQICPVANYKANVVYYGGLVGPQRLLANNPHAYSVRVDAFLSDGNIISDHDSIKYSVGTQDGTLTGEAAIFEKPNGKGRISFNLLYPTSKLNVLNHLGYNISDVSYTRVPKYNEFANQDTITVKDGVCQIGNYLFSNWSNPFIQSTDLSSSSSSFNNLKTGTDLYKVSMYHPIGTVGKCILFNVSNVNSSDYMGYQVTAKVDGGTGSSSNPYLFDVKLGPFLITVADIRKPATPYGGSSAQAKKNSVYYSFGDVFPNEITDELHVVRSGDCYFRMFKYTALHNWYDSTFVGANKMGTVYCVPLFTDIDLHGEYGHQYSKNGYKSYYILDEPVNFDGYILDKSTYLYDTAYNANPNIMPHTPYVEDAIDERTYDARVHYSELKTNNEDIDSWTQFRAMNFSDVDSRFGEITGLKLFKDKLIFWQENATGVLAVNERVILQDANDTQVTLGTGQVLDRYDYISTVYGMKKDQSTACVSNDALYWWDGNNRELLQYAEKYSVVPLSQVKNIRNYINDSAENNHPHVYYNNKYKEVVFQCVNNEAVAYSEILQRFTSVYTAVENNQKGFIPTDSACVNDTIYITDGKTIETDNTVSQSGSKLFGYSAHPYIKYIVNANNTLTKTFDTQIIGGELYGGSTRHELAEGSSYGKHRANGKDVDSEMLFQNQPRLIDDTHNSLSQAKHILHDDDVLKDLEMRYNTPLKQTAHTTGTSLSNREYDYRLNIPRETGNEVYGGRLKGKTMQCELWSTKNSIDFSLQYIITKYRMSWS